MITGIPRRPLGELVDILSGFAFKSKMFSESGGLPIVRIRDVKRGFSQTFYDGDYDTKFIVQDGDLLVGMDGEFNLSPWKGGTALLNQRVCRVSPRPELHYGYLRHFLPRQLKKIEDVTPFVTVKHLSVKTIRAIQVPLPPLPEQRRIAAILDKADAIRRKRREAIALTEELLRSTFLEMFGDPVTNPKGWPIQRLGDIANRVVVGHVGPTSHAYTEEGVPFLRTGNVRPMRIDLDGLRYVVPEFHAKLRKSTLRTGDVLISRVGANRGMSAVVPPSLSGANCANIVIVGPGNQLSSDYLAFLVNSEYGQRSLLGVSVGSAQGVINTGSVKRWVVPVPPLGLCRSYNAFSAALRDVQARQARSMGLADDLFHSLVQRAFRGELSGGAA